MKKEIVYRWKGMAFGYPDVRVWTEAGKATDLLTIGTVNGNIFVKIENISWDLGRKLHLIDVGDGRRNAFLLTDSKVWEDEKLRELVSVQRDIKGYEILYGEYEADAERHIVITEEFLQRIEELESIIARNIKLFGTASLADPCELMNERLKEYERKKNALAEKVKNQERELLELREKVSSYENLQRKVELLKEHAKEHERITTKKILEILS